MGAGTVVSTLLGEPNVQTALYAGGGSSDYPTYMDQFNRTIKNQWERLGTGGTTPVFVDLNITGYNRYGQPTAVEDMVLASGQGTVTRRFDAELTYDRLRRVVEKEEGQIGGTVSRTQLLVRNLAGALITDKVDLDGNGLYTDLPSEFDNGEMDDSSRTYNDRNELVQRVVTDVTGTNTYDLTYDPNGNLTSDDEKYDYVYNPLGQLVQVKLTGTATIAANYTYNALGHRNSEQTDRSDSVNSGVPDGMVDAFDMVYFIATDPQGRRVATYRTTDADAKECFAYHNPSGFGKAGATGPILRTRNSLEQNPVNWTKVAGSTTHNERYYYISDFRGNVSSIVSSGGEWIEQYRYSATGVPMGIPRGDVNSDGLVDGATSGDPDYDESDYMDANNVYGVRGDWNLDGTVDGTDTAVVVAQHGAATARLVMSGPAVGNQIASEYLAILPHAANVSFLGIEWATELPLSIAKFPTHPMSRHSIFISTMTKRRDYPIAWDTPEAACKQCDSPVALKDSPDNSRPETWPQPQYPRTPGIPSGMPGSGHGPQTPQYAPILPGIPGCRDVRMSPSFINRPNGCGEEGGRQYPAAPIGISFLGCCYGHDCGYGTCGRPKEKTDQAFWGCMVSECVRGSSDFYTLAGCLSLARIYYSAVDAGAGGAYRAAQDSACICCDQPTPHPECNIFRHFVAGIIISPCRVINNGYQ